MMDWMGPGSRRVLIGGPSSRLKWMKWVLLSQGAIPVPTTPILYADASLKMGYGLYFMPVRRVWRLHGLQVRGWAWTKTMEDLVV